MSIKFNISLIRLCFNFQMITLIYYQYGTEFTLFWVTMEGSKQEMIEKTIKSSKFFTSDSGKSLINQLELSDVSKVKNLELGTKVVETIN